MAFRHTFDIKKSTIERLASIPDGKGTLLHCRYHDGDRFRKVFTGVFRRGDRLEIKVMSLPN